MLVTPLPEACVKPCFDQGVPLLRYPVKQSDATFESIAILFGEQQNAPHLVAIVLRRTYYSPAHGSDA